MTDYDTANRVLRYLERRIAWFEKILRDVNTLDLDTSDPAWDYWIDSQQQRSSEMEQLAQEHEALLNEWQGTDSASASERQTVRRFAERAERLQNEVLHYYAQTQLALDARMDADRDRAAALRKGKQLLDKYRPGNTDLHDFLDRRA